MSRQEDFELKYGTYYADILLFHDGAVADFVAAMELRRYSTASIRSYLNALKSFFRFPEAAVAEGLQDITTDTLERYRLSLVKKNFSWYTRDLYLRTVRRFFDFLEKTGRIFLNPASDLTAGKMERPRQYIPTEEEMMTFLAAPDDITPVGIRDRAVLELTYSCGMRLEELAELDIHAPDFKNGVIRVLGKGAKERALPMGRHALFRLQRYFPAVRDRLLQGRKDEEGLWIGRAGRRLQKPAVGAIFAANSKKAGIGTVYPHAVRRACATHMLANGAHPEMIRQLLGHADMSTLSRYLEVSVNEMKESHGRSGAGK